MKAIGRLASITKAYKGDFDIESEEAQVITDDVVRLLHAILRDIHPLDPPFLSHNLKRDPVHLDNAEASSLDVQDMRIIKRMRGMLESAQGIAVRGSSESCLFYHR